MLKELVRFSLPVISLVTAEYLQSAKDRFPMKN